MMENDNKEWAEEAAKEMKEIKDLSTIAVRPLPLGRGGSQERANIYDKAKISGNVIVCGKADIGGDSDFNCEEQITKL